MNEERTLTQEIVTKLGSPREALAFEDLILLGVLLALVAAWLATEYGLGRLLARLLRPNRSRVQPPPERPDG
jgi:hypothetical protein